MLRATRSHRELRLLFPAELTDQRHELRGAAVFDLDAGPDTHHSRQPLIARFADRDDQLAGPRELFEQRLRALRAPRRRR